MQNFKNLSIPRNNKGSRITQGFFAYFLGFSFLVISILASYLTIEIDNRPLDKYWLSYLSFICIGVYSLVSIYYSGYSRPFSLNCSHWFFIFFFFFYAAFLQFLVGGFPIQADIGANESLHLKTNFFVLIWCVCYTVTYKYIYKSKRRKALTIVIGKHFQQMKPNYILLTLLAIATTVVLYIFLGTSAMISRAENDSLVTATNGAVVTPLEVVGRALPISVLTLIILYGKTKNVGYYIALVVSAICTLLANSPTSVARFWSGAIVIGFVCLLIRNRKMTSLWLPTLCVFGFLIIFPFLNLFRSERSNISSYKQNNFVSIVTSGDFDAYEMFINTIHFGEKTDGVTMGRQLIGNLLFFVPRTMWSDKPTASSTLIVKNTHLKFHNLSEPLPAEGYVNFGAVGVVLFSFVFALVSAHLDFSYWNAMQKSERMVTVSPLIMIIYPFLVGLVIYMMRGSLLSSLSSTMGFIVAVWVTVQLNAISTMLGAVSPRRIKQKLGYSNKQVENPPRMIG